MLDTDTKKKIDSARDILVGKIPDPTAQVDQITTALIYKFMDDMDQESKSLGGTAKFFVGDFKKYSWPKIIDKKLSGQERLDLYIQAIDQLPKNEKLPALFREIFKNAFLPYRDAKTLYLFLKEINGFSYDHSENLGNAFEYLLSILGSQGDAGQFRTPRHIIDFIVEVIDPKKEESILDPACGTSGFLISSYKHIIKNNSKNYDPEKDNYSFTRNESSADVVQIQSNGKYKGENLKPKDKKLLEKNIVGYDISPKMVKLSLVNMYLHHFKKPEIYEYDTLTNSDLWDNDFNVILANPPFMSPTGGIRPHNKFSVKANRAEVLFVDYIAEHLTINGRAGVIVPEGIIFKSDKAYKALRKRLVEDQFLWAVASLPAKVFEPYSGVKTSILFLDKKKAKSSNEILFVDIQNDGFDLGATRRKIDKNDLPQAFKILKSWSKGKKEKTEISHWVSKEKIIKNEDYNLNGNLYKEVKQKPTKWPMVELGEVCKLVNGYAFKSQHFSKQGISVIRISNIRYGIIDLSNSVKIKKSSEFEKYSIKKGDLLIAMSGATTGKVGLYLEEQQAYQNQRVGKFKIVSNTIEPKYRNFIITNLQKKILNISYGGAQPNISPNKIEQIQIPLPPLEVQKEIVAEIEDYQKIIDGAKQVVENWKPTLKINPNWPMVELGEVTQIISGQSPKSKYYNAKQNGLPFYQGKKEFKKKYLGLPIKWTTSITKIALPNDILMSVRAPVGPVNITQHKICIGRGLSAIRVKKINQMFLFYFLKNNEDKIIGGGGSVFNSISQQSIKKIKIPLPPLKVQREIVDEIEKEETYVDSCKKLIKINTEKIQQKINKVWEQK